MSKILMPSENSSNNNNKHFIIGIGTSAGGLEALKTFFDNIPSDFNHAIVIVQHLSPDYKSLMADLLSRNTELPIHEVVDATVIKSGNVYLIPPKKNMTINRAVLYLTDKPVGYDLNLPIDIFFKSLAKDQGEQSIGIILSGTGSDGTRGIRTIKELGGMLMVQQPTDAKFDGMPNSAIATGLVDYVLPASDIPAELVNFIKHPKSLINYEDDKEFMFKKDFNHLISLVHKKTGIDFSDYKLPTLVRRVVRRMSVNKSQTIREYLNYVIENHEEIEVLYREFLIGVTKFFRDTKAFEVIEKEIIPDIFKDKTEKDSVKVWSVGCSSGEEAYSLAILIREYMEKTNTFIDVKIFATDLNKEVINKANKGAFTESIVADISLDYLKKYFIKKDDLYYISPVIRKMIIFSQHNVAQDPPLTKMDLITCRNLLIYLESGLQQKIIGSFHYSLKPNKYLFIGPSESIGHFTSALKVVSRKWRVYKNIIPTKTMSLGHLNTTFSASKVYIKDKTNRESMQDKLFAETLSDTLLEETGAASAYVDKDYDLISADGNFKNFFVFPDKKLRSFNILKMLPQSIAIVLSTALRKADKEGKKVVYKDILVTDEKNKFESINLIVKPIKAVTSDLYNVYLILFFNEKDIDKKNALEKFNEADVTRFSGIEHDKKRIVLLEQELRDTQSNLQAVVEEIETSNEELQATNEELLSSNEELQSTNEELQSVNEELHTVNSEYQEKMEELAAVNSDLGNLMESTNIGTIFLDRNLNIRKLTPAVKKFFNIIESDIGRSITHFNITFGESKGKTFINTLKNVLNTGEPLEKEILHGTNKWYLMRLNPFLNSMREIEGVVISFVDVTPLKVLEKDNERKKIFLEKVINVIPNVLYIFNQETQSNEFANREISNYLGYSVEEVQEMKDSFLPTVMHPEDLKKLGAHFVKIQKSNDGEQIEFEYRLKHRDGSIKWFLSKDTVFERIKGSVNVKYIGVATDVTELKESQQKLSNTNKQLEVAVDVKTIDLQKAEEKYHTLYDNAPDMFVSVDPEKGTIIECNKTFLKKTGFTKKEIIGCHIIDAYADDSKQDALACFNEFATKGKVSNKELKINKKGGGFIDVNLNVSSVKDNDGNVLYSSSSWRDITDIKNVLSELEELTYASTHDLKAPINNIGSFLSLIKEDKTIVEASSLEAIGWIESNLENANNTLENLMSVAKARTLVLDNLSTINVENVFQQVFDRLGLDAGKKTADLTIATNFKESKEILFSEAHFKSMLQNILNNAIKYQSPKRGLVLSIKSFNSGNFNCVSITDNGIGIDLKEHRNHVFGLFKRASDDFEGSGLALYLIKKIIEKAGGKIEVDSEFGKGSTFTLYFKK